MFSYLVAFVTLDYRLDHSLEPYTLASLNKGKVGFVYEV